MISIAAGTVIPPKMLHVCPMGPLSVICSNAKAIAAYEASITGLVRVWPSAFSCIFTLRFSLVCSSSPATKNTPSENSTTLKTMLNTAAYSTALSSNMAASTAKPKNPTFPNIIMKACAPRAGRLSLRYTRWATAYENTAANKKYKAA